MTFYGGTALESQGWCWPCSERQPRSALMTKPLPLRLPRGGWESLCMLGLGGLSLPASPSSPPQTRHTAHSWHQAGWESRGHGFSVPRPFSPHSMDVAKIACVVPLRIMPKDYRNPRVRQDDRLRQGNLWRKWYWKSGSAALQGFTALYFLGGFFVCLFLVFFFFIIREPNF